MITSAQPSCPREERRGKQSGKGTGLPPSTPGLLHMSLRSGGDFHFTNLRTGPGQMRVDDMTNGLKVL